MKKKYTLKNKKRFSIFISLLVLITLVTIFTNTVYGFKEQRYSLLTVKHGDTLWDIANRSAENKDIREFIYEIKTANNLSESEIFEGSVLKIPLE